MEEKHLQQHIKGTHEEYRPFVCSHCSKAFGTSTRLLRHEAIHTHRNNQLRCVDFPPCERGFKQQSALERHIRSDHLNLKPYLCKEQDCGASYDSAGALRNHTNREHTENKFWCDECPRPEGSSPVVGFTTKSLLQAHMRNEHMNCVFCSFKCTSKYDLNKHIEVHHSGMTADDRKTFPCIHPGCDKKFTKRSNLNVHTRVAHEGVRFICGATDLTKSEGLETFPNEFGCARAFASKANLEDHVRHVHLGVPRLQRPNRRITAAVQDNMDYLGEISGAIDADKRTVECPRLGCNQKFIRHHDLQLHLPTHDAEVQAPVSQGGNVAQLPGQSSDIVLPGQDGLSEDSMPHSLAPDPLWPESLWPAESFLTDPNSTQAPNLDLFHTPNDPAIDPALNAGASWPSEPPLVNPSLTGNTFDVEIAASHNDFLQPFSPPSHNEWMASQQQEVEA